MEAPRAWTSQKVHMAVEVDVGGSGVPLESVLRGNWGGGARLKGKKTLFHVKLR